MPSRIERCETQVIRLAIGSDPVDFASQVRVGPSLLQCGVLFFFFSFLFCFDFFPSVCVEVGLIFLTFLFYFYFFVFKREFLLTVPPPPSRATKRVSLSQCLFPHSTHAREDAYWANLTHPISIFKKINSLGFFLLIERNFLIFFGVTNHKTFFHLSFVLFSVFFGGGIRDFSFRKKTEK